MAWGRVDDRLHERTAIVLMSPEAFKLWFVADSWSRGLQTEGLIPAPIVERYATVHGIKRPARALDELSRLGALEPFDDGAAYRIHDLNVLFPDQLEPREPKKPAPGSSTPRVRALRNRRRQEQNGSPETDEPHRGTLHETRDETESPPGETRSTALHVNGEPSSNPVPEPVPVPVPEPEVTTSGEKDQQGSENKHAAAPPSAAVGRRPAAQRSVSDEAEYGADFDEFWQVWPRKESKNSAFHAYVKRRKARRPAAALLVAAQQVAEYQRLSECPLVKIPYASSFLNDLRDVEWERGLPEPRQQEVEQARKRNGRATPHDVQNREWNQFSWRDGDDGEESTPAVPIEPAPNVVADAPYAPLGRPK